MVLIVCDFMIYTVTLNPAIDETLEVRQLLAGGTHRILSRARYAGGKGINAARALRVFAEDCTALTIAGGATGQQLAELLRQEGLPCTIYAAPQPTRVNLKIVSDADGITTELNETGFLGDTAPAGRLKAELLDRLKPGDTVVLCGSLPRDLPAGWYRDCITACRAKGARVYLDSAGEPLILGIEGQPDCIKPNREELEPLYGYRLESTEAVAEAAWQLLHRGVGQVVVSLGAEGALLATRRSVLYAAAPSVTALNTTGAGDTMTAALVYAGLHGLTSEDTLRFAVAAASAKVVRSGNQPPVMSDISALLPRVTVQAI